MAAPRARAVLLGLVLALCAAVSPAAASLPDPQSLAGTAPADQLVLDLLREAARAQAQEPPSTPEEPSRPAFTLWPEPPPPDGQLFARTPAPPLPEPVVSATWLSALDLASGDPARLPETRVRAFGLFGPGSRPCPSRVSLRNATGLRLGLLPACGGAIKTWLSEDPAGAVDSPNLYAFVAWQPSMATDPMGLCIGEGLSCSELLGVVGDAFRGTGYKIADFFTRPFRDTAESAEETAKSGRQTDQILRSNVGNRDPVIDALLAEDYDNLELPARLHQQELRELGESARAVGETAGHAGRTAGHALDATDRYLLGTGLYKIAVIGGRRVVVSKGIEELLEEGAPRLTDDVLRLTERNLTNTGDTILGSYPGYVSKATARGASYFDIGEAAWEALGDDALRWEANQHFLDIVASRSDRILLSTPKLKIQPDTWLAREVQYLTQEKGYVWVNQWSLRPGG
jgi:hypothetical protein